MARPQFQPSPEQRKLVQNLASINCTQEEIIEAVPWPGDAKIDLKTLRLRFADELTRGKALAHVRVKRKIADMIDAGNTAMTIFYAKTQLGWKETYAIENTGKDGAPLPPTQIVVLPAKDQRQDIDYIAPPAPRVQAAPPLPPAPPPPPPPPAPPPAAPEPPPKRAAGSVAPVGSMWPSHADRFDPRKG